MFSSLKAMILIQFTINSSGLDNKMKPNIYQKYLYEKNMLASLILRTGNLEFVLLSMQSSPTFRNHNNA